jgi:hypothetical protein
MAGLVPAIHAFLSTTSAENVDGRDEPGHEDASYRCDVESAHAICISTTGDTSGSVSQITWLRPACLAA